VSVTDARYLTKIGEMAAQPSKLGAVCTDQQLKLKSAKLMSSQHLVSVSVQLQVQLITSVNRCSEL
jgi:hypothetical protein